MIHHDLSFEKKSQRVAPGGVLFFAALLILGAGWASADDSGLAIGSGSRPAVATDRDGNSVVVWEGNDGDGPGIFARTVDRYLTPVDDEFRVNSNAKGVQSRPDVVFLANGDLVVVWEDEASPAAAVRGRRFMLTPLDDEFTVSQVARLTPLDDEFTVQSGSLAHRPALAADGDGNFVVAWSGFDQANPPSNATGIENAQRIVVQGFDSQGHKTGPATALGPAGPTKQPDVAAGENGELLVVWEDRHAEIRGQAFSNLRLTPLDDEFHIQSGKGTFATPSVTTALDGDFTVVWDAEQSAGHDVLVRRVSRYGSPLDDQHTVNAHVLSGAAEPSAAGDGRGNTLVAWRAREDDRDVIYMRRVGLDGLPIGDAVVISSKPSTVMSMPRVTPAGPLADFLVVWEEDRETARSAPGVMGQFVVVP